MSAASDSGDLFRRRLRENVANAKAAGVSETQVLADVIAALRGHAPSFDDYALGGDVVEFLGADLTGGR